MVWYCLSLYTYIQIYKGLQTIFYQVAIRHFEEGADFQRYLWAVDDHEVYTHPLFTLKIASYP